MKQQLEQVKNLTLDLESRLEIQETQNKELQINYMIQVEEHSKCNTKICNLKICLYEANEKNEILSGEINVSLFFNNNYLNNI